MLEQITKQPEAIATAQEALVQTVAERWGYDFGRRTTQSELMSATWKRGSNFSPVASVI